MSATADGHPNWGIDLQSGNARVENPAGPTTASQPTTPEAGAAPAAAQPGTTPQPTTEPTTPGAPQGDGFIPKYRYDTLNERVAEFQRQNEELRDLLRQSLAARQAPEPPAPPPTEEEAAYAKETEGIRQEFFRRFPDVAEVLEKWKTIQDRLEALTPIVELAPQFQEREDRHWGSVANRRLAEVQQQVAAAYMGGAAPAPGSPPAMAVARQFFEWTSSDPQRVARYEADDPTLVQEFVRFFGDSYIVPWRPAAPAGAAPAAPNPAQAAIQRVSRLPVAGPGGIPGPQPPTPREPPTEEGVHAAAWAHVKAQQQALGQ